MLWEFWVVCGFAAAVVSIAVCATLDWYCRKALREQLAGAKAWANILGDRWRASVAERYKYELQVASLRSALDIERDTASQAIAQRDAVQRELDAADATIKQQIDALQAKDDELEAVHDALADYRDDLADADDALDAMRENLRNADEQLSETTKALAVARQERDDAIDNRAFWFGRAAGWKRKYDETQRPPSAPKGGKAHKRAK
jgi:chromosome segregation ATPase